MMGARIHVIYGQYGILFSYGMYKLANRIRAAFPNSVVTTHNWSPTQPIENDLILQPASVPKILIGYSLGANDVPYIASRVPGVNIALGVCYDPSQYGVMVNPIPQNIKRLLLYHNVGNVGYGHAIFYAKNVERTDVNTTHRQVCKQEDLHLKTLAAIGDVLK